MMTAGDAKLIANDYWDTTGRTIVSSCLEEIKFYAENGKYSCTLRDLNDHTIEALRHLGFIVKPLSAIGENKYLISW